MKDYDDLITRKTPKELRKDFLAELENLTALNEEMGLEEHISNQFKDSINQLKSMRYIFFYAEYCDQCLKQTPKFMRDAYGLMTNEKDLCEQIVHAAREVS